MKTLITLITLIFTLSVNAQLSKTRWQWQNPDYISISQIVSFDNGKFVLSTGNLSTGEYVSYEGTYSYDGETLILYCDNDMTFQYAVERNGSVMNLYVNNQTLKFAICGSVYDTYMQRVINSRITTTPSYNAPAQPRCYTCYGSGSCQICKGSGWCSGMYGQPGNKCKACNNSSGKCWHCNGSGKQ